MESYIIMYVKYALSTLAFVTKKHGKAEGSIVLQCNPLVNFEVV